MTLTYPTFLDPFKTEILLVAIFFDGLLLGMAIRFGVKALILAIIAVAIAGFLGISFIPTFSVSSIYNYVYSYITTAHFGILTLTGTVIAFIIGLIVGLLGFAKK
ncbi:MAG: hypothetical protein ACP5OC_03745 [Thermoplasmata archaeon]